MASLSVKPPSETPLDANTLLPISVADEITFWHWLIMGIILIGLEIFAPGVVFMWVGIAALITGAVSWLSPDLSLEWLVVIFAALSVVSVVMGRAYLKKKPLQSDHPNLNQRGSQYIGRHFELSEAIEGGFGKIKVDDTTWKVSGPDAPVGSKVEVVASEGTILKVEIQD